MILSIMCLNYVYFSQHDVRGIDNHTPKTPWLMEVPELCARADFEFSNIN